MADQKKSEPEIAGHEGESAPPASEPASISPPAPSTEPYSIEVQLPDALTGYRREVEQMEKDLDLFMCGRVGLRAEQETFDAHLAAQWREAYVSHGIQLLVREIYPLMVRGEYASAEAWERAVRLHTELTIKQWKRSAVEATPGVVWRRADDGGHFAMAQRQLEKRAAEAEGQKLNLNLGERGAAGGDQAAKLGEQETEEQKTDLGQQVNWATRGMPGAGSSEQERQAYSDWFFSEATREYLEKFTQVDLADLTGIKKEHIRQLVYRWVKQGTGGSVERVFKDGPRAAVARIKEIRGQSPPS